MAKAAKDTKKTTKKDAPAPSLLQTVGASMDHAGDMGALFGGTPVDPKGKAEGNYLVAIDTVDAGVGETVLIVSGSSARMASGMKDTPVDAAIVGIVDSVDVSD